LRLLQNFVKEDPLMDVPKIGFGAENTPRVPLGIVPVEEDGSAHFLAPPNKELILQILDEDFRAVQSMRSVVFVHKGEHLTCQGCHELGHSSPPLFSKFPLAFRRAPSTPRPELGKIEPISFLRQVQPIIQATCLPCHSKERKGPLKMNYGDFSQSAFFFSGGFLGNLGHPVHGGSRTIPGFFGARACLLGSVVFKHWKEKKISDEQHHTLVLWMDANSPRLSAFHGVRRQEAGELVWPRLDIIPDDPLGLEGSPGENTVERIFKIASRLHPSSQEAPSLWRTEDAGPSP
jgi:hypothetical protein